MYTIDSLMEMAEKANGRRRRRILTESEASTLVNLMENAAENIHIIRVYSQEGFVANSYKSAAPISYFFARKDDSGEWVVNASVTDAKRSYGQGALVTVNGRGI